MNGDVATQKDDVQIRLTAIDIRDRIVECFTDAHTKYAEMPFHSKEESLVYCRELVRKMFLDTNGDFNHPNKESLIRVLDGLAKFSKHFRDQGVIERHYQSMMTLVNNLDEVKENIPLSC